MFQSKNEAQSSSENEGEAAARRNVSPSGRGQGANAPQSPISAVLKCVALYDYEAKTAEELSFCKGDTLYITNASQEERWLAKASQHGPEGYVSRNYVGAAENVCGEEWYFGCMSRREAEHRLAPPRVRRGTFIVRDGENSPGTFALSIRDCHSAVKHYKIKQAGTNDGFYIGWRSVFRTLEDLVRHYQRGPDGLCVQLGLPSPKTPNPLNPDGDPSNALQDTSTPGSKSSVDEPLTEARTESFQPHSLRPDHPIAEQAVESTGRDRAVRPKEKLPCGSGDDNQDERQTTTGPKQEKVSDEGQKGERDCEDEVRTEMLQLETKGHAEQSRLSVQELPIAPSHRGSLNQKTSLQVHVQSLNIESHHAPVFLAPVISPTFVQGETSARDKALPEDSRPPGKFRERGSQTESVDPSRKAAEKTRDALKRLYKTEGGYVQMTGVDNDQMHMADIYTDLRLHVKEGLAVVAGDSTKENEPRKRDGENQRKRDSAKSSEYQKIFRIRTREGALIKRLILYGVAGLGKSTFFDKVAYDWAVESCDVLNEYMLVFVLKMCALDETSDLIDSIFAQLLGEDTGVSKEALQTFIQDNPDKVLILLDGIDELKSTTLNEARFGSILKALNRKTLRECCVCVTARPSYIDKLMTKSLVQNPCAHIEVLGFAENDVKKYVSKFFREDRDKAGALVDRIRNSDTLSDLSKSPMLLLWMCLLMREYAALPETMSRLYDEAVHYMFARRGNVSKEEAESVLLKIGKVGLRGLLSADQKLTFEEDEFETNALDLALKVGILSCHRILKNQASHKSVQFIHETVQEYCAAKYWQSRHYSSNGCWRGLMNRLRSRTGEFQRNLELVCRASQGLFHFAYLLRFCCGDNEKCADKIIARITHLPSLRANVWIDKLISVCYFESQSEKIPSAASVESLVRPSIQIIRDKDYFLALVYFLSSLCKTDTTKAYLARIESMKVSDVASVSSLASPLRGMVHLGSLTLYKCSLTDRDITEILLSLEDQTQLSTLDVSANQTLGGVAAKWAPSLKHLKGLKVLCLMGCDVTHEDVEHVALSLSDMTSVTVLDLTFNEALGGSAHSWSCHLHHMKHLHKLLLCDCSLQCTDVAHIAPALGRMTKLTDLNLSFNRALGGSAEQWSPHLCHMRHLRSLGLCDCSLQCEDVKHLAFSLRDVDSVAELNLSRNSALGDSAELLSRYLRHMKHLQTVVLSGCLLRREDIVNIRLSLHESVDVIDVGRTDRWSI